MPNPTSDTDPFAEVTQGDAEAAAPRPSGEQAARLLRMRTARRSLTERKRITQRLRQALAENGFVLHYQPQFQLSTGAVTGVEALLRLRHRRRGLILPGHFMPVAERGDIIHDIGEWVLDRACGDAASWPNPLGLALSLSPRQLRHGRLVKHVIEALGRSGLAPERLRLGLPEIVFADEDEDTLFNLKALQNLGLGLGLEDFGLGFASLNVLKRLKLATLKLNRALVRELNEPPHDAGLIHAAVDAGHALGCLVLADGVETEAQFRSLNRAGCDRGQGAYFAAPAAQDAIPQLNLPRR